MRPGRLDRILFVGPPDQTGREEILRIRTRGMKIEPDLDIEELGKLVDWMFTSAVNLAAHQVGTLRQTDALVRR